MTASYSSASLYSETEQVNVYLEYLDTWKGYYLFPQSTDQYYTVQAKYDKRPDLLSFDTYGTAAYWWVFAVRNPDTIKDPIYDLRPGISIYIPDKSTLPVGI